MRTDVLLSIKPEFAEKILNGSKQYEFRRVLFKNRSVRKVVIYASAPIQKVVGDFEIEELLTFSKDDLWNLTKHSAGIEKVYFDQYFSGKSVAYAIKVRAPRRYKIPKSLTKDYALKRPPQSFVYLV